MRQGYMLELGKWRWNFKEECIYAEIQINGFLLISLFAVCLSYAAAEERTFRLGLISDDPQGKIREYMSLVKLLMQ